MSIAVSSRWRFRIDSEQVSLHDLSWHGVLQQTTAIESADVAAETKGECVQCQFNATHAAVLYMGPDKVILRPFFPDRPVSDEEIARFFCGGCGVFEGPTDEYLARFFPREDGFRFFEAVLCGPPLPTAFQRTETDHDAKSLAVEWRPLLPHPSRPPGKRPWWKFW